MCSGGMSSENVPDVWVQEEFRGYGSRKCSGGVDSGSVPDVWVLEVFRVYGSRRRSRASQVVASQAMRVATSWEEPTGGGGRGGSGCMSSGGVLDVLVQEAVACPSGRGEGWPNLKKERRCSTRQSTTLSSKINLHQAINGMALWCEFLRATFETSNEEPPQIPPCGEASL